jgi:3-oxoacyl-[acyl-carrier-protein] synthase III
MKIASKRGRVDVDIVSLLSAQEAYDKEQARRHISKTGPIRLRICGEEEDSHTLGSASVVALLAKLTKSELDLISNIISVTETPRLQYPGNSQEYAQVIREELNNEPLQPFCLDLNAGCTGFVDALRIAARLDSASIIVTSETYSKNYTYSRNISSLFGDAAAAVYFNPADWAILGSYYSSAADRLCHLVKRPDGYMEMNGQAVFGFVTTAVTEILKKMFDQHPTMRCIYIHQASAVVLDFLKKRTQEGVYIPRNIERIGNNVSASIPLLIEEFPDPLLHASPTDCIGLLGFGVGLSVSGLVIKKNES